MRTIETIYEDETLSFNAASMELLHWAEEELQLNACDLVDSLDLYDLPDYEATETLFYHLLDRMN